MPLLEEGGGARMGGTDSLPPDVHGHQWAWQASNEWYSFIDADGGKAQISDYYNGFGEEGQGYYPLMANKYEDASFYTDIQTHDHGGDNRPAFTQMHFMCRIR